MPEQTPTPPAQPPVTTFFRAFIASENAPRNQLEFSEPTITEKAVETLLPRLDRLDSIPLKYLRSLIDFTDVRVLQLTQAMARANDTITVAHIRGQLKEMENLQNALRLWLDVRKENS